jgi:hypothetical protein
MAFGNRTLWPQLGQTYSLRARWRSGVRHFGHGIGFALTYAANISCDRRSSRLAGPALPVVGSGGGATARVGSAVCPSRVEESRPHCGQTARLSVPVDCKATWQ